MPEGVTFRWLISSDRSEGNLVFASEHQISAIQNCHILVADATFELVRNTNFRQVWTIHGLYEIPQRGAEWIPLAMAFMEYQSVKFGEKFIIYILTIEQKRHISQLLMKYIENG